MALSNKWGTPLIVIGIILIVLDIPQFLISLFTLVKILSSDVTMNTYHRSYFIGLVTAQLLFLIIGLWLIVKGKRIRKMSDAPINEIK